MHRLRKSSRLAGWLLALSLVMSPVLAALQGGVAAAAPEHEQHHIMTTTVDHAVQHAAAQPAGDNHGHTGCTQHDACHGSCCVGCGHCAGAFGLTVSQAIQYHPILTPHVTRLFPSDFLSLRERPPRTLSA